MWLVARARNSSGSRVRIEGRGEEQDERLIAAHEMRLDRGHRARGAGGVGGPGQRARLLGLAEAPTDEPSGGSGGT
jgi:hypothetical protein